MQNPPACGPCAKPVSTGESDQAPLVPSPAPLSDDADMASVQGLARSCQAVPVKAIVRHLEQPAKEDRPGNIHGQPQHETGGHYAALACAMIGDRSDAQIAPYVTFSTRSASSGGHSVLSRSCDNLARETPTFLASSERLSAPGRSKYSVMVMLYRYAD